MTPPAASRAASSEDPPPSRSVRAALHAVEGSLGRRLDVREWLDAERLVAVAVREGWSPAALAAGLASRLAHGEAEWHELHDVLTAKGAVFRPPPPDRLPPRPEKGEAAATSARTEGAVLEPAPKEPPESLFSRARGALGKLWDGARTRAANAGRGLILAAWLAVLAMVVLGLLSVIPEPVIDEQPAPPTVSEAPTVARVAAERVVTTLERSTPERTISVPRPGVEETVEARRWVAGVALGLVLVGLRLLLVPRAAGQKAATKAAERRADRHRRRAALEADRRHLRLTYRVPIAPAFSRRTVEDAATYLGRIRHVERPRGLDADLRAPLDVNATLDESIRAGGRFSPVFEPAADRRELLVLVDVEKRDHPSLGRFTWLLDAWRELGVRLHRRDFGFDPTHLRDPRGHVGESLETVSRQLAGFGLLVFSRRLRPLGYAYAERARDWTAELGAWPVRAWIDPDPRPLAELTSERRREIRALARLGLRRFPFSEAGLLAVARALASGDAHADPPQGTLPPLDASQEDALRRWAFVASLVPDPTWAQLEAARRAFPELHQTLPDAAYVHRLIEHVQRHARVVDADGERLLAPGECEGDGTRLYVPEVTVDRWIREEREREREQERARAAAVRASHGFWARMWSRLERRPERSGAALGGPAVVRGPLAWLRRWLRPEAESEGASAPGSEEPQSLESRARRQLLALLGDVPPEDGIEREWWQLKKAQHEAILRPWEAERVLGDALASVVADEAAEWIHAESARRAAAGAEPFGAALTDRVDALQGQPDRVALRELLGHAQVWGRAAVIAGVVALALLPLLGLARPFDRFVSTAVERVVAIARPLWAHGLPARTVELPASFEVRQTVLTVRPATELRPAMVRMPTGTFEMGSPDDEPHHIDAETAQQVTITRAYELSLTEITQGQYELLMGTNPVRRPPDGCAGRELLTAGDLGRDHPVACVSWRDAVELANRLSAKEGLTPAYEVRGNDVRVVAGSAGYRLPTEAEWEHAARAGTRELYARADAEQPVCRYGNVADASLERENPAAPTFDCDDGVPGLAQVGQFEENAWGLVDMQGNVAEWVQDYGEPFAAGALTDPLGPSDSTLGLRVVRGASWGLDPRDARVAFRRWGDPSWRVANVGFRLARSLP